MKTTKKMTKEAVGSAKNLDELLVALKWPRLDANGEPLERTLAEDLLWTELPTYGGAAPESTSGVWSWDATRLLVGPCARDLHIIAREDECL